MKRKLSKSEPNIDVRFLTQRESKINTRKGITKVQETVNIAWLEREQLLFDNSQRNCNGYIPEET